MSAALATSFSSEDSDPANRSKFFSTDDEDLIRPYEKREFRPKCKPDESCNTNLFFGFFLDGTRNNYGESIKNQSRDHSNVARLYSCYPGQSVRGVVQGEPEWKYKSDDFKHFFRVYTPGVGTAFDQVDDSGKGKDETLGAAAAYKGEPRIIWTILQAINNLHRFFKKDTMLFSADEAKELYSTISLNKLTLAEMTEVSPSFYLNCSARKAFEEILRRLHKAIEYNMPPPDGSKPKNTDPGLVQQIYVSAFGFSRGAAAARAFANWLVALCKLDAQLLGKKGHTLGGFPVNFDFLGLFDTVASVGLANTLNTAKGHWAWADAEVSLRVPKEFAQCLHLVSGHEVRRSFPLDSISHSGALGTGRMEVVYPGVHSDVGGGYRPKEHGKGKDPSGKDMLSRLPLAHMYRAARLAGVPLKLDLVEQQSVKDDFRIAPETIAAFNDYVSRATVKSGSLTDIIREQCKFHMLWRHKRRQSGPTPLEATDSYLAAPQAQKNDLRCANEEFTQELNMFVRWREGDPRPFRTENTDEASRKPIPKDIAKRAPGFGNRWEDEWMEIARFWDNEVLPAGMENFFDNYVHDSRAAFKLTGTEADKMDGVLQALVLRMEEYEQSPDRDQRPDPLSRDERKWALTYQRTGKIPSDMKSDGREPAVAGAGYLRYRKVYAGGDSILISQGPHWTPMTLTAYRKTRNLEPV